MKQKLLLLAAVFFGFLAFIFFYQVINRERQKIQGGSEEIVVVSLARDLAEGQKLSEEDMLPYKTKRYTNAPRTEILWTRKDDLIGAQTRVQLDKGSIPTWEMFKRGEANRNSLSSRPRPGFRAISIPVDAISSVSGLIQPNNHVDIIGTFHFPDAKGDAALDTVTMTILQRVRVLACGNDMGLQAGNNNYGRNSYGTISLELTPKEVEMIVFATQKGRLVLSLRGYEDTEITDRLQSVDWNFLQKNIQKYTEERREFMKQSNR